MDYKKKFQEIDDALLDYGEDLTGAIKGLTKKMWGYLI